MINLKFEMQKNPGFRLICRFSIQRKLIIIWETKKFEFLIFMILKMWSDLWMFEATILTQFLIFFIIYVILKYLSLNVRR